MRARLRARAAAAAMPGQRRRRARARRAAQESLPAGTAAPPTRTYAAPALRGDDPRAPSGSCWPGRSAPTTASAAVTVLRGGARAIGAEDGHEEELFGPAEGLHATYRMVRDEVLEASLDGGRELNEMRLDTAVDVNRAVARYLELLKLAALDPAARATEPTAEALRRDQRPARARSPPPEQREALDASALDELPARRRARARRRAPRADRRARRALARGLPAAPRRRAWRCRPPTSTSTGRAR